MAAPWARRTLRLAQRLVTLGVALGGKAGVHRGQYWGLTGSRQTLRRLLCRLPLPVSPTPRVLRVDEVALRNRHTSGTILVDRERRRPVALLPDRPAEPVAPRLREHPGVAVIARDRSSASAAGARQGAPAATQVADRCHRLQHLRAILDEVFTTPPQALDAVKTAMGQQPVPRPAGTMAVPVPPPVPPPRAHQQAVSAPADRARAAASQPLWTPCTQAL